MDNSLFVTLSDTIDDLFENRNCLIFRDFLHGIDLILQRPILAKLNDHELEVSILKALIAFEKIGAVELHHDFRFLFGQSSSDSLDSDALLALDISKVENFYGNEFFGVLVNGFVDLCKGPFSDLFEKAILFDFDIFKIFFQSEVIFVGKVEGFVSLLDLFIT